MTTRIVLLRYSASAPNLPASMNDEIGLEPHHDYLLREHLEDLASEGISVVARKGSHYLFSDGTAYCFEEQELPIDFSLLDDITRARVLRVVESQAPTL